MKKKQKGEENGEDVEEEEEDIDEEHFDEEEDYLLEPDPENECEEEGGTYALNRVFVHFLVLCVKRFFLSLCFTHSKRKCTDLLKHQFCLPRWSIDYCFAFWVFD